jgi:hypothetical protein
LKYLIHRYENKTTKPLKLFLRSERGDLGNERGVEFIGIHCVHIWNIKMKPFLQLLYANKNGERKQTPHTYP